MSQVLFVLISVLGLLAALGTVLARNLVHAALFLVAFFFIVSCQFVMLEAEFLAAIQVLVYIGAVSILMMFGIMLTRNIQGDDTTTVGSLTLWPSILATLALFVLLTYGMGTHEGLKQKDRHATDPNAWAKLTRRPMAVSGPRAEVVNDMGRAVGYQMLTRYALPFEVAGLLLTAALVGAVALAHRETDDPSPTSSGAGRAQVNGDGGGRAALGLETATPVSSHS